MDLALDNSVAVVTGGSSGIGKGIAVQLAREGCRLALVARDRARLSQARDEIATETGVEALIVQADTGVGADVDRMAAEVLERFGGATILVNAAGVPGGLANGPLENVSDDAVLADLNTKYLGYLRCARALVPAMKQQGSGRLIHIGGLSAREAGSYSAGARNIVITHLSKTLSEELGPFGITSNVVHPGKTLTADADESDARLAATNALRRPIGVDEIAYVVAFLASARSASITGESIGVGGGRQRGLSI